MQDIKNKLEEKIVYFFLTIINSKESEINSDSCDEEYINKYRIIWENLSFEPKSTIKIKVENLDNFEFEQVEPFYDKSKAIIYYKENTELDELADALLEIFDAPKSLEGDFKYILTKNINKIKIENNELLNIIDSLWIQIDDDIKNNIVEKLKIIGFKDDIIFKLSYAKEDYDCNKFQKTESEIQIEINELIEDKEFKIKFDFKKENLLLVNRIRSKLLMLDYPIEDEIILMNKICLTENDIYNAIGKTKEELDLELAEKQNEDLAKDYNISSLEPEKSNTVLIEKSSEDKTTNIGKFKDKEKGESNRTAKKRGLAIEVLLVKELAKTFENDKPRIKKLAKEIFAKMQKETLGNGIKRFYLEKTEYQRILDNDNLEDILHVSKNMGDGLGFDVFFPVNKNNIIKLLKVEVKSSKEGKNIYLSESERKQILLYDNKEDDSFRVYLYIHKKAHKNITGNVYEILEANNNFSNIKAETWILDVETID